MMPEPPIVMFYVQHLFGIGHVFRASRIAMALAEAGCTTHLVWGGTDVPNLDSDGLQLHRLVPVRVRDETFSELVHADGRPFGEYDRTERCRHLLGLFEEIAPDILITEAYPFGRRQMRFELIPLIAAARRRKPRPLIVSSIRDIMQQNRKQNRVRESIETARENYDLVLVHGDPSLVRIEATLQGAEQILDRFRYTGLVMPEPAKPGAPPETPCNVLVSSGGGANGFPLLKVALPAMRLSKKYPDGWRFIAGTEMPASQFNALVAMSPDGVVIERYVDDMVAAMKAAKVSVSRSGYNTVADILRSGCTAILVPFTGGRETEQRYRARLMDEHGIASMLDENILTPEILARAVDEASPPKKPAQKFRLDGEQGSVRVLLEAYAEHVRTN